ncbi:unnamed protein product, partial [Ixodes pacificus]
MPSGPRKSAMWHPSLERPRYGSTSRSCARSTSSTAPAWSTR